MPCPCFLPPRLFIRLSSAELPPSAVISTPSIRAFSFHHSHISSCALSFSPIPLAPPCPLLYPTLQLLGVSLPKQNPSLSLLYYFACIISWAPRTLPRALPILGISLQGWSAQSKDATAARSGDVQHQVCPLKEKHKRGPVLKKEEKCHFWGPTELGQLGARISRDCTFSAHTSLNVPFWGGLNAFNLAESGWFSQGTPSLTDQWDHRTGLLSQI